MINLLPPEEKNNLLLRNKEKLAAILGIAVLVSLVCLILVLSLIKLYIKVETGSQRIILEQAQKEYLTPDSLNFKIIIYRYNRMLAQIESFYEQEIFFNQALKVILDVRRPEGLYLTNLSLTREGAKIKVTADGTSDCRDNLLLFQQNIERDKKIENSYFPPENWTSPKDINFKLTFEISKDGI